MSTEPPSHYGKTWVVTAAELAEIVACVVRGQDHEAAVLLTSLTKVTQHADARVPGQTLRTWREVPCD